MYAISIILTFIRILRPGPITIFILSIDKRPVVLGAFFYDKLTPEKTGLTFEDIFNFSCDLGRTFVPTYTELVNRNRDKAYGEREKNWQGLRRGRYVEFNLVYDSGTRFGLETNGRIESILMSLPAQANWAYDFHPEKGSLEEETLSLLKKEINWTI